MCKIGSSSSECDCSVDPLTSTMLSISPMPVQRNSFDDLISFGGVMEDSMLRKTSSLSNITATLDIGSLTGDLQALLDNQADLISEDTPFCSPPPSTTGYTVTQTDSFFSTSNHATSHIREPWGAAAVSAESTPSCQMSPPIIHRGAFSTFSASRDDQCSFPLSSAPSDTVRYSDYQQSTSPCDMFTSQAAIQATSLSPPLCPPSQTVCVSPSTMTSQNHSPPSPTQYPVTSATLEDPLFGSRSLSHRPCSGISPGLVTATYSPQGPGHAMPMPNSPPDYMSEASDVGPLSGGAEGGMTTEVTSSGLEILHPRVLDKEESAHIRKLRSAKREVKRLRLQKEAFERLSQLLPYDTRRMSRLDLLKKATEYIGQLKTEVDQQKLRHP